MELSIGELEKMGSTKLETECCPDCGRQLHSVWDYPANELWCVHCGNRYFATMESGEGEQADSAVDLRVLLLDESSQRRDQLVRHLTGCGCHVTPVRHPRQALEAASFRRFDVVVLSATLSEFECPNLVGKLGHLLGNLKFIVIADEGLQWDTGRREWDVVCVESSQHSELERNIERLLDEVAAARLRHRESLSESEELLGIA
jgi:hypothetical protein